MDSICICRPLQSMKSLSKLKSVASLERPRSLLIFDAQWLEEFRKNLHSSLTHIEERFNRLVNPSMVISSIDEHSNQIQGLFNFIKNVEVTCSGIQSTPLLEKQNDIKAYINQMTQKFSNEQLVSFTADMTPHLIQLLYELLVILISHIHTYSNAFLIPYEVDIYNDENESFDIQRLNNPVSLTHSVRTLMSLAFSFSSQRQQSRKLFQLQRHSNYWQSSSILLSPFHLMWSWFVSTFVCVMEIKL